MQGVGGRKPGSLHHLPVLQDLELAGDQQAVRQPGGEIEDGAGHRVEMVEQFAVAGSQGGGRAPLRQGELPGQAQVLAGGQLLAQFGDHSRMGAGQLAERHGAARADAQPGVVGVVTHVAVAAQAGGVHVDGFDHGAPAADPGSLGVEPGQAVAQHGDVGGGAAHVDHPTVAPAGQVPGADDAGGRAREDGLYGPRHGPVGLGQGAVAFDDHQRRADSLGVQGAVHGGDQLAQQRDQPGVECGSGGAAHGIELAGQLVAAGDGQAGQFLGELADSQFMGRVAHPEVPGDGEGLDLVAALEHGAAHGFFIERLGLVALAVVAAAHVHHVLGDEVAGEAAALDQGRVVADEEETDRGSLILDDGIGRQGGRQADQVDLLDGWRSALAGHLGEDRLDGAGDANG